MSGINQQRQTVREKISFEEHALGLHAEELNDALTGNLRDFIGKLVEAELSFPEDHRAAAKIELKPVPGYCDDATLEIGFFYERPETDEELADRLRSEGDRAKHADAKERREYARLKAKFG